MSALREVLAQITAARGGVSLDEVARRIGVSRTEVDAMVDYWVRKGRLSAEPVTSGCPSDGCGGCPSDGACATPAKPGPVLVAITSRPPRAR
ncbi:FeoC-like transcriptional regulator [Nocardia crassostreae]|uniref:FeoC-like transcriptional regulator n=1 Tax=Nocardia crassostreae TaxID=53428 RepID=UPI00082B55B8|nr:FeoC-like transcriptional regulator [Nocardia crassostreae]